MDRKSSNQIIRLLCRPQKITRTPLHSRRKIPPSERKKVWNIVSFIANIYADWILLVDPMICRPTETFADVAGLDQELEVTFLLPSNFSSPNYLYSVFLCIFVYFILSGIVLSFATRHVSRVGCGNGRGWFVPAGHSAEWPARLRQDFSGPCHCGSKGFLPWNSESKWHKVHRNRIGDLILLKRKVVSCDVGNGPHYDQSSSSGNCVGNIRGFGRTTEGDIPKSRGMSTLKETVESKSRKKCPGELTRRSNLTMYESINQSINQSIGQSINQSTSSSAHLNRVPLDYQENHFLLNIF